MFTKNQRLKNNLINSFLLIKKQNKARLYQFHYLVSGHIAEYKVFILNSKRQDQVLVDVYFLICQVYKSS